MIAFLAGVQVWSAGGVTDMRRGMNTLALQVHRRDWPHPACGRDILLTARKGDLVKILWHDGVGMSLDLKRLEAGEFIWPLSTKLCRSRQRSWTILWRESTGVIHAGRNALFLEPDDERAVQRGR